MLVFNAQKLNQAVKDAAPDGNTLMIAPLAVMVVQPIVFKNTIKVTPNVAGSPEPAQMSPA